MATMKEDRDQVLRFLADADDASRNGVRDAATIAEALGLTVKRTISLLEQLNNDGLILGIGAMGDAYDAQINAKGLRFLEEGSCESLLVPASIHIGAINYGSIGGSQAGQTGAGSQTIIERDTPLSRETQALLDQLAKLIEDSPADVETKEDALSDVVQFATEVRKYAPNRSRLLSILHDVAAASQALALSANAIAVVHQLRAIVERLG